MNIIAIDCGASFIKGALISSDGVILARCQRQAPDVHGKEDILTPHQIDSLCIMVEKMIEEFACNAKEIKLCVSNEMHGFMLAYENGAPYTDYISWQKEFGSKQSKSDGKSALTILSQKVYKEEIVKTGMPLRAGLPSCNLFFLNRSGYLENFYEEKKLYFYTLGDYIIHRFAGIQPICHPSNAAATGLYHLEKNIWNKRLIDVVCGKCVEFPEIGSHEVVANRGGVTYHIYPAIGDQQAALLGAGLMEKQELSFNLGTGAQVSLLTDMLEFSDVCQIRPYFAGNYIKTIPHLPSGRALNVYIRFFEDIFRRFHIHFDKEEIWKVLINSAQAEKSNLVCDMSFFENAITDHMTGSIQNIGEFDLSVSSLMSAILKEMVKNYMWAADKIQPNREHVKRILFSGGIGKKIGLIRDQIAEHYSEDVTIQVAVDETLIGLYRYTKGA